ncbi:MAG TPA: HEAT repeat domain-containing protein [Kofleriaceae bacterium]|nr:HEAT repeat domain-containing protein [Kofleriaceae bacterium]
MHRARRTLSARRLAGAAALLAALVALPAPAVADRVDELIALVERKPDGMTRDQWREKRRDAARELGKLGDRRAVPALIKVVETEEFDVVGEIAIESLGLLGDARAAPVLQKVIEDPSRDRYVREAARKALRRVGGPADTGGGAPANTGSDPAAAAGTDTDTGTDTDAAAAAAPAPTSGLDAIFDDAEQEIPRGPAFDDDILGATERITFALGGVRLAYDTVRETPTLDGDVALGWERTRDRERSATRLAVDGAAVAGVTDYPGAGQSSRYGLVVASGVAEARLYAEGRPVYGLAAAGLAISFEHIKVNRPGTDADVSETLLGLDAEVAIGGGYGRVLDVGEALRLRRIELLLRRARALGRPITPDLAERILATWWALRGELGAHRRLTATVALLREAGVLLGEPDASLTYQILQVLLDGQLARRPRGLDIQLGVAESYLVRDDALPVEDGRIESVFAGARYGSQSTDGTREIVGRAIARYRVLPEDGDPTPWSAVATAAYRTYFYSRWSDPVGALELTAEVGASDDGYDGSEIASRLGAGVGWLWSPNRASRFRVSGQARWETGELFLGAAFEVTYGLLDAVFVGSGAYPR